LARLASLDLKGLAVREARVESRADFAAECYLSLALDPAARAVLVMVGAEGGIAIEEEPGKVRRAVADPEAIAACVRGLCKDFPPAVAAALGEAAEPLADAFLALEATLLEINPLFALRDGGWLAGDAKLVTDDNALSRRDALSGLLAGRAAAYPDVARKQDCGFDYVVVDPAGEVGLLTTGAGLSMMLIDEMRAHGLKPYNFLDIRSGELRGDPARLVQALRWIMEGPNVRVLLMNFFAGVTDLGELARLILEALEQVPEARRLPIVARLVGNGFEKAQEVASAPGSPLTLETDLDAAVEAVRARLVGDKA
ncbi:MAG: ATP-grasp domain-containing protein, partial [Acetobacterales bacterium]